MKKLFTGIAITLVLLLAAAFTLPFLFKNEILSTVKSAANEELNATVDFKDVNISLFRHFPKLSVGLEGLDVTGKGQFDGVKLVQCERLDLAVDLWSALFGSEIVIRKIYFQKPVLKVYALSDGSANYDITQSSDPTATQEPSSGVIKLEHYEIEDGKLLYDDRSIDMILEIEGLDHKGSGEFTADVYDLVMKTHTEKLSVNYGGVQYLRNARADWNTTLGADMASMKFEFKENNFKVNDLALDLNGWFQMPENTEDIRMDITFGTPENTFKSLLSIIPGAYTQDFNDVKANGTIAFSGAAKGTYNEKKYPAFNLNFKVANADFKYPSLPLGVSGINVDAKIACPTERINDLVINIPAFRFVIGSNPLEGYFNLKTPESDPNVDTKIKGKLNLGELTKAFPVEGVQELSGLIDADVMLKAAMSQLDAQAYDQVNMGGEFKMSNINYRADGSPTVKINALDAGLTPQKLDLRQFDAKLGRSDLRASGQIDNVLAYFSTNKTMRGNMAFESAYFDANEWMEPAPADGSKVPSDVPATASTEAPFDRWDFMMDGKISRLKYETYDISNLSAKGHFTPNVMNIDNFALKIGGTSDLSGNGKILNAWNYLFGNQTVAGVINLNSNYFDLNQFMTEPAAAGTSATTTPPAEDIIPVPENMDMQINANFNKIKYTNYDLQNLSGQIVVKEQSAKLKDCTANLFSGLIGLTGEYNTLNPAKPVFNMDMAIQNMGFKEAYNNMVTVKTLAPVAQLIDGKFNTTLSLSGFLGKDMVPDFSTLNAAGFLETISALFSNFKPMTAIGDKLNVEYLKKLELANTKNWFEVKDGFVTVKPFNVKMKDVNMLIQGGHGLTNEMNYQVVTKVPRTSLQKSTVGAGVNAGLNYLSSEAAKNGVSIANGEYINVRFDLTGSLFNPKVGMKVLGSDGQSTIQSEASGVATAVVDKARDSVTNIANRELEKAKQKATEIADKAVDTIGKVVDQKVKEATEKVTQEAKEKIGEEVGAKVGDKAAQKAEEVLGDKGKKSVDEAKKKLETWDPFKKKNKN